MVAPSFMEGEGLVSMYGMDTAAVKFIFADTEKVLNFISLFIRDLKVSGLRASIFETATLA
jgi:hypothetical protein